MRKSLTDQQVQQFKDDGFLFPYEVYSPEEAGGLWQKFNALEKELGEEPQNRFRIKAHLPFPWLCDVVSNEKLLDALEDLIGPNILCWGASFFTKKANDPRFISWHTDSFVYGFEPAETVTAWLGFNDSTIESGCLRYIPGSHKQKSTHEISPHPDNLATLGQNVIGVPEDEAVYAELKAGQVVFHHESVVHSSGPNNANHPRIGFSIHYVAPHVRETRFEGATAMLLRGEDKYGYWGADPMPQMSMDPVCIEAMLDTREKFMSITEEKIEAGGRS
ncbi:MAG: phytanoyl-CoA dioxygenase family protein [Alphaproteobacteria bacterium]